MWRAAFRRTHGLYAGLRAEVHPVLASRASQAAGASIVLGSGAVLACQDGPKPFGAEQERWTMLADPREKDGRSFPQQMIDRYSLPVVAITAINVAVFMAWRVPNLAPLMTKHFTYSVEGLKQRRYHTLLTSVFSHESLPHLGFNIMAFASMSSLVVQVMGASQFVAFYLGAGLFSSLGGAAFAMMRSRLVGRIGGDLAKQVSSEMASTVHLGASGAVFAVFAVGASLFPERSFVFIFMPFYPISAGTLLPTLAALDCCGLIYSLFRHSPLAHAAHLAGVMAGLLLVKLRLVEDPQVRIVRARREAQQSSRGGIVRA